MKTALFIAFIFVCSNSAGQEYRDRIGFTLESIADLQIGWIKIYDYSAQPKGKQLGNRIYSARQIGNSQHFIEWMQKSYQPKGCLGDAGYYQNYIPKFSGTNSKLGNAINTHAAALPHMYGAYSKMYMFLKKDAAGKFVPQNNFGEFWQIEANQLQYISLPVSFISDTTEYYFVLPDYGITANGYNVQHKAASELMGFNNLKSIQNHKRFYIPPKIIGDNPQYVVIMTKHKELPFEKVTIGEFFNQAEKQFPGWQQIVPIPADQYLVAQKNLARLKEKYKGKWNDVASLKVPANQLSLYDFVYATEGKDDMFDSRDINGKQTTETRFPVLKVNKVSKELCKTDQPQWIVIRWTMGMPEQAFNQHLHKSILNNFNFEYVYNFFFDEAKIKGQIYKPLPL